MIMTSKQAFNEIKQYLHGLYRDNESLYDFERELNIIDKDLEVLEIIKPFLLENQTRLLNYFANTDYYDLVDEWLER